MRLNRRNFFLAASGAVAYASSPLVLKRAGIAGEEPIRVGTILDVTGVITQYGLPPSRAITMAIEEINAAGGLLGRPVEQYFYDSQSNNQFNAQYTTQALVRDKVDVIQGGLTSSSREVMRPIVQKFGGLLFYNSLYEGGVCDRRHVCCALVPSQQLPDFHELCDERAGWQARVHTGRRLQLWPHCQPLDEEVHRAGRRRGPGH